MKLGPAFVAALVFGLSTVASGGAATPGFAAPDCPAQLRQGATLSSSLLSDATHTVKRYAGGNDTSGGEIQCSYYDTVKSYNYGWDLYYAFKTDTAAQLAQYLAAGYAPLGGWAHPLATYCGVSKAVYAYVDCNSTDPDTVAAAKAMLAAVESMAASQAPATPAKPNPALNAVAGNIKGEVEFSDDGGKTFKPLTASTVLKDGDFVSTGYEESVTLKFAHGGSLTIHQLTQLRIDEYVNKGNIVKQQMFLNAGLVAVKQAHHTAAIRSDFSVVTPTCAASIRGSGMIVSTSKAGVTSIYTTADVSYVKGLADKSAITVRTGYMTTVGANKKATKPVKYTAAALKKITG